MHPKDRAGPPRVIEESDNPFGLSFYLNGEGSPWSVTEIMHHHVDEGGARYMKLSCPDTGEEMRILRDGRLSELMLAGKRTSKLNPCPFIPGSKECNSGGKNVHGCDGSFETCCRYGNQENFGGQLKVDMWHDRGWSAEDFPIPPPSAIHDQDPTEHILNGWNEELVAPVTAYEVGGKIYRDWSDAVRATTEKAFLEWYEDNTLYGNYEGCRAEARDMLEWIKENRHALAKLLKTMV